MSRRILVKVSPQGAVTIEAEGFHGKGCTGASKAFEEALGGLTSRSLKPEFVRQGIAPSIRQRVGEEGGEP